MEMVQQPKKNIGLYWLTGMFVLVGSTLWAQFDPPAGQAGSLAIHQSDSRLLQWATTCTVVRGWQDISQPQLGVVTTGIEADALGMAGEGGTLSLGDGGTATLSFAAPIRDGDGVDFVVFENAFSDTFLELALVEVSSDGQHFVRFPAVSHTPTDQQIGTFGAVDARHLYNLAGKYRAGYGTGFDLSELKDSFGLDIQRISHVRIIDVVGSIHPSYAVLDSRGGAINDPWTTPFPQGGFDLDAVAVLHPADANATATLPEPAPVLALYPNPVAAGGQLYGLPADHRWLSCQWSDPLGRCHGQYDMAGATTLNLPPHLSAGLYYLTLRQSDQSITCRVIVW